MHDEFQNYRHLTDEEKIKELEEDVKRLKKDLESERADSLMYWNKCKELNMIHDNLITEIKHLTDLLRRYQDEPTKNIVVVLKKEIEMKDLEIGVLREYLYNAIKDNGGKQ